MTRERAKQLLDLMYDALEKGTHDIGMIVGTDDMDEVYTRLMRSDEPAVIYTANPNMVKHSSEGVVFVHDPTFDAAECRLHMIIEGQNNDD